MNILIAISLVYIILGSGITIIAIATLPDSSFKLLFKSKLKLLFLWLPLFIIDMIRPFHRDRRSL